MIKKNTKAVFDDSLYKGEKDWKGGIPLSEGEIVTVHVKDKKLKYKLYRKTVDLHEEGEDQIVNIVYYFKLE